VPAREIGHIAGRNIFARIVGKPTPRFSEIPFKIVARDSTK
jgi:DNA-binding LacI/PurR family transcriptional regulator